MLISCFTNSYGRFGAKAAIEHVRSAGIEYVELPIRTAGKTSIFGDEPLFTHEASDDDVKRVEDLLAANEVKLSSCNITSGNPLEDDIVDLTKRKLDLAARFGVSLVVGEAGNAEHDERPKLFENLRTIGDHAAGLGITYCFETHPGICVDHRGMLEAMQELDHPNLKLNFDTGNLLYYNENANVEIALAKVCPHVKHVHLKDTSGEPGDWHFPALGYGAAVDFLRVLQLLRDTGFTGPFSLEIEGIKGEPPLSLEETHQRIVDSVDTLESCGYLD